MRGRRPSGGGFGRLAPVAGYPNSSLLSPLRIKEGGGGGPCRPRQHALLCFDTDQGIIVSSVDNLLFSDFKLTVGCAGVHQGHTRCMGGRGRSLAWGF